MAQFDAVFAELQAKMAAAMAVISQDPVMAQQVRDAIDGAEAAAVVEEAQAQDDARANALNQLIVGVRGVLADAVGVTVEEPVVEEPVEVVEPVVVVEEPVAPVEEPPVEEVAPVEEPVEEQPVEQPVEQPTEEPVSE
jgi:hypothetical protein